MESSVEIEERAAQWLARRDREDWNEGDERDLAAWLDESTANTVAFIRLEAAWNEALRLKALGAGVSPKVVPPAGAWHLTAFFDQKKDDVNARTTAAAPASSSVPMDPPADPVLSASRTSRLRNLRVAAGLALFALLAGGTYLLWPVGPIYRTPVGGMSSVPMADGSKITLNTDSSIRVDVTPNERQVNLERGEAFFDVAKDLNRPFVVVAGNKRITVLGTQFSVRHIGKDVRVFVTEGKVRVDDRKDGEGTLLSAGSVARVDGNSVLVQNKPLPEVQEYLAWRSGYVVFHDSALGDAVAEFNRYNSQKIVIRDPDVAATKVSGKFKSTNFEAFIRLLEDGFPIGSHREDDNIVLTDAADAENHAGSAP